MRAPCVVLLGIGKGAGLACAHKFVDAKWNVVIVDGNHNTLSLAEKDLGTSCHYLHEDQFTRLGLKNALSGTLEQFDGVDVVVSVPPIPEPGDLASMTAEAMTTYSKQSVQATLLAAQIFSKEMIGELETEDRQVEKLPQGKSFIHVLSRAAISSDPGYLAASVTQGAMLAAVKALAIEFAPFKIRSNAVVAIRPRAENTEPWLKMRTPLERSAKPSEVADTVFFLASAEARFITGQGLELDGGRSVLNGVMKLDETAK
ncbi:SDR family NAD(P)-dependent oxidoreductase [Ponticaulis profundi]|uniref:SDR family NAD(P)-dependent oxidoreductase n=1 Tax=Ponticaulis profundi TaxID=2665222 RepID=A0ABW1S906_9PROT